MSADDSDLDFSLVLGNAVHDMKNSVAMLLGAVDGINEICPQQDPVVEAAIGQLRYEGKRLSNNLVQLLTLYRINDERYSLNLDEQDVAEVLEECFLENEGLLSLKGIGLEMDCDEELLWFFDRSLITGLINSVINNAYKYTRDRIRIGARRTADNFLVFTVEENGEGYPQALLHAEPTTQTGIDFATGSTGLGLYFASTIAAMHRHQGRCGYLTTSNEGIDGGGCFSLFLP